MCKSEKQKFMKFLQHQNSCSDISWIKYKDTTAKVPFCNIINSNCKFKDCPKFNNNEKH